MARLTVLEPPAGRWEAAKRWREGGNPTSITEGRARCHSGHATSQEPSQGDGVVRLAMLRPCHSERYGVHIPRMFHDLLMDIEKSLATRTVEERTTTAALHGAGESSSSGNGGGCDADGKVVPQAGKDRDRGLTGAVFPTPVPVAFHVTEYDVVKGQYPESWEDYAGYIIPGGVASACGDEPWMKTLLSEVQGLRDSGRPVLAFCLGHQVIAQALGGLVRQRTGPRKHYALQESELLLRAPPHEQNGAKNGVVVDRSTEAARSVVLDAVASIRRQHKRGGGAVVMQEGDHDDLTTSPVTMRLLYHHNDEVVKLPPGASNISTSRHCNIHGMIMMKTDATGDNGPAQQPNLLSFQAHPELNYEYGRRVMDGLLDSDVTAGRLTHEKARRLKEQVSAWDHTEFPIALELMRKVLEPTVAQRRNGGGERDQRG